MNITLMADQTTTDYSAEAPRPIPARMLLLLAGGGLLVALVLLELCVRSVLYFGVGASSWNDRPKFYLRAKGAESLQGNVFSSQKAAGVFRIVVVGDSISFGPHLQYDDTFSARLQRMLNANRPGGYEVINLGVPGHSTWQEVLLARRALELGADLVLLQITLNDAELEPVNLKHGKNQHRFGKYRPEGWTTDLFTYWRTLGWLASNLHNRRSRWEYKRYFYEIFEDPAGRQKFLDSLTAIERMTSEKKVSLASVVFPLFGFPIDEKYPFTALHEQIAGWLKERNIRALDLLDAFRGIPPERLQVVPGADLHPNEIAHRIAAESLYRFLVKDKLLGTDFELPRLYTCRTAVREAGVDGGFPSRSAREARHECLE